MLEAILVSVGVNRKGGAGMDETIGGNMEKYIVEAIVLHNVRIVECCGNCVHSCHGYKKHSVDRDDEYHVLCTQHTYKEEPLLVGKDMVCDLYARDETTGRFME